MNVTNLSVVGNNYRTKQSQEDEVRMDIALDKLKPFRLQPASRHNPSRYRKLAKSIEQDGLLYPIYVLPADKNGIYEVFIGHGRWGAYDLLGLSHIPAIVKNLSRDEALEVFLREQDSVTKHNTFQNLESYLAGAALSSFVSSFQQKVRHCQDVFGKDLSILIAHKSSPNCGLLIKNLHSALINKLLDQEVPSKKALGAWFVKYDVYRKVYNAQAEAWPVSFLKKVISCYRRGIPLNSELPHGPIPKKGKKTNR